MNDFLSTCSTKRKKCTKQIWNQTEQTNITGGSTSPIIDPALFTIIILSTKMATDLSSAKNETKFAIV